MSIFDHLTHPKLIRAYANANIALVKYWGKNNSAYNIPLVSSLSMTLDNLGTTVAITPSETQNHQAFIDNKPVLPAILKRLTAYLEQVRTFYPYQGFFCVTSQSTVPFEAGLASSAAFFAALAVALNDALQLGLDKKAMSTLARLGSGSAARSLFYGFSGLYGGEHLGHDDAYAFSIEAHANLKLAMAIAVVDRTTKPISSRDAMNLTKKTSPFFKTYVEGNEPDFIRAQTALKTGLFEALGETMENSTLKMFATMWTAKPAIIYSQPNTLALIDTVHQMRAVYGPKAFFTMDAGPNVKVLCEEDFLPIAINMLRQTGYARDIIATRPGAQAQSLTQ